MASDHGSGAGAVFMAFVLGAITGAAVALLWAPASGEEARRYLGDRAREGADRASDAARQFGDKVREGREKAGEVLQQGREYLNRQRDTLASAVESGREAFKQARDKEQA